jgi:arylsulfatase A-like enzyme
MFRSSALTLWTRLICFACVTALLAITLSILAGIDGWLAYETRLDVFIDIAVRVAFSLAFGVAVGTAATLLTLPYVLWQTATKQERVDKISRVACTVMILGSCSAFLGGLLRWSMVVGLLNITNRTYIFSWCLLSVLAFIVTLIWYVASPRSAAATNALVSACSGPTTRRLLLLAGTGTLLTAVIGKMAPRTSKRPTRAVNPKPAGPNVLMVTFDALTAEDMSCYGYPLPTTPHIDALSQSSSVFSNYYTSATFTTPCIVSMLTGRYPSSTHVYHYGGRLQGAAATKTLPNALRAAGYTTAASVANPGAHPDCLGFGGDFDYLPPPPIKDFAAREAVAFTHSAVLADDAGFVARIAPYVLEQMSPGTFGQTHSTFPPNLSFQQAGKMLDGLEAPFFLWIHVFAPHFPYLPEPPYLKKFLHGDELRTHAEFADMVDLKGYNYSASKQPVIDKARLRYNEWIAQADGAFGQFMTTMRSSGRLDNTAVIVSSDHGESFQGGYLGHGGSRQLRPILHVPLIVHLPGQTQGRRITTAADQTALAPTILDIVKIARPEWMEGRSLCAQMCAEDTAQGRAFTQCLDSNSVFKPIERGTVGVVDGQNQYVVDLETKTGALYDLNEAHEQKSDRSLAEPNIVADLRGDLARRFPDLLGDIT